MSTAAKGLAAYEGAAQLAIVQSVVQILWRSVAVVALTELSVMLLLEATGEPITIWTAILDTVVLSAIALPILYAVILKPVARLAAERAAAAAEARFQTIAQVAQDGIVIYGSDRTIRFANAAIERMHGYTPGSLQGMPLETLMPEEEKTKFWESMAAHLQSRGGRVIGKGVMEFDGMRKDGKRFPVEISVSELADSGEAQFVGVARDVTVRKLTERLLKESEAQFRLVADSVPALLWMSGPEGQNTFANKEALEFIGLSLEEAREAGWTAAIHPEDRERAFELIRAAVNRKEAYEHEFRILRADGEYRWFLNRGRPRFALDGSLEGYSGSCVDITERKQVETALRQAEEKYRSIFEEAVAGTFQTTPEGSYLSANPALARMYGFDSPEELMSSRKDIASQAYVDPGRRQEFKQIMEERGVVLDFEYQVYRKDGSTIWLLENARAIRDASGAILYYTGAVIDVTQRKRAEEALVESEAKLRKILESLPVAVRIVRGDAIVYANPADARLHGYASPQDEIGVPFYQHVVPEERDAVWDIVHRQEAGQPAPKRYQVRRRRADGSEFHAECTVELFEYEGQKARLNVIEDLTDRERLSLFEMLLPVCCVCGKIRNDEGVEHGRGDWERLDQYVTEHSDAQVSHTFCPECLVQFRKEQGI